MFKAKILLGLPLAGKSTWVKSNGDGYNVVSADFYKENHPEYCPDNVTEELHLWSTEEARKEVHELSEKYVDFIMDGGGINNSYTKKIISGLHLKGYTVELVHVKTPLEVCLERNKLRERKVPVSDIEFKAGKEFKQFHELSEMCDKVTVVNYFTNKHIFVDMDGVICALGTLPVIGGKIDFVNTEIYKHLDPVTQVIDKLDSLEARGYTLYILSGTVNSFSYEEKNYWLDKHFNIPKERRYFVNSGRHKAEMLNCLVKKLKLDKKDVTLVDDTQATLYSVKSLCMNPMHVSEFLVHKFNSICYT